MENKSLSLWDIPLGSKKKSNDNDNDNGNNGFKYSNKNHVKHVKHEELK